MVVELGCLSWTLLGVARWVAVVGDLTHWEWYTGRHLPLLAVVGHVTLLWVARRVAVEGHLTQPRCLPWSGCLLRLLAPHPSCLPCSWCPPPLLSPHPLLRPLLRPKALGGLARCRACWSATSR